MEKICQHPVRLNKISTVEIKQILRRVKQYTKNTRTEWDLSSFENFIISFEKNTQLTNEEIAKNYGNIIKNLVRDIMTKDAVIMPDDDAERTRVIVKEILNDNALFSMFNKLYTLILKSHKNKEGDKVK